MLEVGVVITKNEQSGVIEYVPVRQSMPISYYITRVQAQNVGYPSDLSTAIIPEGLESVEIGDVVIIVTQPFTPVVIAKLRRYSQSGTTFLENFVKAVEEANIIRLTSPLSFLNNLLDVVTTKTNELSFFYTFEQRDEQDEHGNARPVLDFASIRYRNKMWMILLNNDKYFYTHFKLTPNLLKFVIATQATKPKVFLYTQENRFEIVLGGYSIIYRDNKLYISSSQGAGMVVDGGSIVFKGSVVFEGPVRMLGDVVSQGTVRTPNVVSENAQILSIQTNKINNVGMAMSSGDNKTFVVYDLETGNLQQLVRDQLTVSPINQVSPTPPIPSPTQDNETTQDEFSV